MRSLWATGTTSCGPSTWLLPNCQSHNQNCPRLSSEYLQSTRLHCKPMPTRLMDEHSCRGKNGIYSRRTMARADIISFQLAQIRWQQLELSKVICPTNDYSARDQERALLALTGLAIKSAETASTATSRVRLRCQPRQSASTAQKALKLTSNCLMVQRFSLGAFTGQAASRNRLHRSCKNTK